MNFDPTFILNTARVLGLVTRDLVTGREMIEPHGLAELVEHICRSYVEHQQHHCPHCGKDLFA